MTTILLVDDDAHLREAAREILAAEGFEVLDFGSAADAIVILRTQQVALAVVDLDVALREGVDLAEAVCETPELDRTALIGVTFDVKAVDLELLDLALQKPYVTSDLPRVIREVLAQVRRAAR
ncbi:MAG: response regulator [Myxococcota bacterium]|nr:response regulator [Myxococcota bacterium]